MWKWTSLLLTVVACGFPRPADVIACTPGEFAECRGDTALTCNSAGADYDAVQCARGCDPAIGCRLCDANQTVCINGKVQSCDATGTVTSSETCPLGCFEDQPRCREIDPSNGLGKYLDMVPNPPDLDLLNVTFNTRTGDIKDGTASIAVPSFEAESAGILLRVFIANSVHLSAASVQGDPGATGPGFALVARGDITVTGKIIVSPGAGGVALPGCSGGFGGVVEGQDPGGGSGATFASGGGGGGHAASGGDGGAIVGLASPGSGGTPSGTASLEPLRGGCAGGFANDVNSIPSDPYGASGGGAIQLSSRTRIEIDDIINGRGRDGDFENLQQSDNTGAIITSGGGAGGGILLEAPRVVLGPSAQLLVGGGHGGSACDPPTPPCAAGGAGSTSTAPAAAGGSLPGNASSGYVTAGGGGGGPGRIRINTPDGTYTKSNTSIEEGSLSTGILKTR